LVVYASLKLSAGPSSRTLTAQADKAKPPAASSGYPKQAGGSGDQGASGSEGQPRPGQPTAPRTPAKSVRDILDAVVKIEMPTEPGKMSIGAGFLIDPRGWVATNYHVIREASSATRVRLFDGTQCKVAGILAQEPSMDLAILKLADPPPRLKVLDISFSGEPEVGEEIQICGHPHNLNFTFDKGTVGRVITTLEMLKERGNPLLHQMHAPLDMVWIQHSARIAPGNSGGPVLNQHGQVVGINSFVNELSFGYAVPVRYLRGLVALCDENKITPLPSRLLGQPPAKPEPQEPPSKPEPDRPPSEPKEPQSPKPSPGPPPTPPPPPGVLTLSPEELQKLYDACCQFYWKPKTPEEYRDLETFARAMTLVKHVQAHPEAAPGAPKEAVAACAEKADQLFKRLQESPWTKEHWEKILALAADQLQPGHGILLRGSVLMNAEQFSQSNQPVLLLAAEGLDRKLLLMVSPEQAKLPVGTKVWLIGRIVETATVGSAQGPTETCPFAEAPYVVKEE
jgi:S1-C subfamily serine protease